MPTTTEQDRRKRIALATRSLIDARRLTGDARREAIRTHFERYAPPPACALRH
jgi:hypothetical protein